MSERVSEWVSQFLHGALKTKSRQCAAVSLKRNAFKSRLNCTHEFNVRFSQCGGKTVPYFRSRHRKTPVSERSVSSRNSESVGVGRAQTTSSGVSDELAIILDVRRGFAEQRLEDQYSQFEDDLLLHWQPAQTWQNWWDVVPSPGARQKSRRCVLGRLQLCSALQ